MTDRPERLYNTLAIICALALMLFGMSAAAERSGDPADALDIDFSINPGEMVAPGDATMTFIITNRSNFEIQNIYLSSSDGLLSEPIGQISAGETQTLVRPHAVTQEELDQGEVSYVISHDAPVPGGEKVSHTVTAAVVKGDARPDVDFTRQLSSRYVAPGGQLTITYKLANCGNVPATDIYVRDTLGDFTGRLERLDIGATKTFISRVTVYNAVESVATLEYTVPSGESFTRRLDPVPIELADSALDVSFSVGRSVFDADRADAILTLTNTGNDDYANITVLDDVYGGVIADSVTLPAGGAPMEIAYTYPVRGSGEYRWRITGVSQAGEALDYITDTITLNGEPGPRTVDVMLTASPRTPKINRAGRVTFDIDIANTGTLLARDLRLYEATLGDVRRLAVLPTGDPCRCQVTYDVTSDSEYVFCVDYTDAGGRPRTVTASPVTVDITPAGVSPEARQGDVVELDGSPVKMGNTSTFTVLLLVASAALVSMITILLITSLRARRERRMRIAAQRQRAREELGKTNAFTPVRTSGKRRKKKGGASARKK